MNIKSSILCFPLCITPGIHEGKNRSVIKRCRKPWGYKRGHLLTLKMGLYTRVLYRGITVLLVFPNIEPAWAYFWDQKSTDPNPICTRAYFQFIP